MGGRPVAGYMQLQQTQASRSVAGGMPIRQAKLPFLVVDELDSYRFW